MNFVVSDLSNYIKFSKPLDLVINVLPASQNPSNTDGLLPSLPQWVDFNGKKTLATIVKAQTGIDPNGDNPDAGFTIYAGNDGSLKNYGLPVWFDPNPQLGTSPAIPKGACDFIGVALHELFHTLGFAAWGSANAPWNQLTTFNGGLWYYSSASINSVLGGSLPLAPNEFNNTLQAADHIGDTEITFQPVRSDLMYQWGNYDNNRLDIGQIDLLILKDLGYTISNYQSLPLTDPLDSANIANYTNGATVYANSNSSIISAQGANSKIVLPGAYGNGNYLLIGDGSTTSVVVGKSSAEFNIIKYNSDFLLQNKAGVDAVSLIRSIEYLQFTDKTLAYNNSSGLYENINSLGNTISFAVASNPIPATAPNSAISIMATNLDASASAFGYYTDNANHTYGFTISNGIFQTVEVSGSTLTKVTGATASTTYGFYYDSVGASHGFIKNQSQITTTDNPLGFYGTWLTTGNSTQAAGAYCDASGQLHGYIQTFSATGSQFATLNDPLGVKGTWVTSLSSDGKAAGFYIDVIGTYHGFTYQGGNFTDINVVSSIHTIPIGINSSGKVVGEYMDAKGWHGFLYSNGSFTPYDYANASLTAFTGINDTGSIVGIATVGTSTQSFATHILG